MTDNSDQAAAIGGGTADGKVVVIGVGLSREDLTERHLALIRGAGLLVGGRRHLEWFADLPVEKLAVTRELDLLLETIRRERERRRVVVLASGDPLCYGIGSRLATALGRERVAFHPNVSAVAGAFARLGEPWQEAALVSLHGREGGGALADALVRAQRVAVFTDAARSPAWVGEFLLRRGLADARLWVFERLGERDERCRCFSPAEAAAGSFAEPNLAVVDREPVPPVPFLGIPEDHLAHEAGLITKAEVRAVAIARLQPGLGQVLWDLGAGSGAVGLEAGRLMPGGGVWAVERNPGRAAQIRMNRRRLGAWYLEVVEARLPEGLETLPDPDRVFMGGGGESLPAIIAAAGRRLRPGGRMVVNTVVLERVATAMEALRGAGLSADAVQVQISRSRPMPGGQRLEALNPVWVVTGSREGEGS